MKDMLILGVNKICNWAQVLSNDRRYTCPIKLVDGKLMFVFKKQLHSVAEYACEHTDELVEQGGRIISRPFRG